MLPSSAVLILDVPERFVWDALTNAILPDDLTKRWDDFLKRAATDSTPKRSRIFLDKPKQPTYIPATEREILVNLIIYRICPIRAGELDSECLST